MNAVDLETPKLRAEGLHAYVGATEAIKGISLSIADRRVTAIIGSSGCGKSTFIRCLNRMHETQPGTRVVGRVLLDGDDIYAPEVDPIAVRRRVGMVFQRPIPFPTMSIRENVLSGLRLSGAHPKNDDAVAESHLRKVALWDEVKDSLDALPSGLTHEQRQRLCIARCLAVRPEVVLMDEPCATLDPVGTAKVEELIHGLRDEFAIAIVTHSFQQAARVSDFTGFFYRGELVEFGSTDDIFTTPRNQQTEDYITGRFG